MSMPVSSADMPDADASVSDADAAIALYVHIPFCETKCPYCDFNTYAAIEPLMPAYGDALRAEIARWGRLAAGKAGAARRVSSVFFGGGTPSYLPAGDIAGVMGAIRSAFSVMPDAEITLEANPGDFTQSKLAAYLDCGINRLSIGIQSFDDGLLALLGRRHSAADAADAYRMAADAGFANISVDLMYGLPRQRLEQWRRTLDRALELAPPHLSMYCLTLEGGTPMERRVADGRMPEPDADLAADMYVLAQDAMRRAGYLHYEISNWALPGMRSRHNLAYWRNLPYLGVGPGAHSYMWGRRFANIRSPREYVRLMGGDGARGGDGASVCDASPDDVIRAVPVVGEVERIDPPLDMAETLMMGLRLDEGVSVAGFKERFGVAPAQRYPDAIAELTAQGLLQARDGALALTARGRMVANAVVSRFFE